MLLSFPLTTGNAVVVAAAALGILASTVTATTASTANGTNNNTNLNGSSTAPPASPQQQQLVELPFEWNAGLIAVSYLIAVAASYSTVTLLQLRLHPGMVVLGAFTLSVAGIWSMHFVGMEALHVGVAMGFEPVLTAASALFAFACTAPAMALVHWRVSEHMVAMTNQHHHHVAAGAIDVSVKAHVRALRHAPHGTLVLSGALIAAGVCSMHYGGMAAMELQGVARTEALPGVIAASVVIAVAAATAALYLAFVLPLSRRFALPTACVMGVAVCGMHYTGIHGFRYLADPASPAYLAARRHERHMELAPYVVCGSLLVSMLTLSYTSLRYQNMIEAAVQKFELYVPPAIAASVFMDDDGDQGADSHAAGKTTHGTNGGSTTDSTAADDLMDLSRRSEGVLIVSNRNTHNDDDDDDEAIAVIINRGARRRDIDPYALPPAADEQTVTSRFGSVNWLDLKMRPANASVMFIDVVDFTSHAERMTQAGLLREMTAFNGRCTDVIEATGGLVDKYLGDAIMAVWNTVQPVPDHGLRAVAAAARCVEGGAAAEGLVFEAKAGVQSGPVLMGNVGSATKRNFTVLGDTVNQASRIEGLTRHYGARVMIGRGTREQLGADGGGFVVRFLDEAVLKGKAKSVLLYEVMADAAAHDDQQDNDALFGGGAAVPMRGDAYSQPDMEAAEQRVRRAELVAAAYEVLHERFRRGDYATVVSTLHGGGGGGHTVDGVGTRRTRLASAFGVVFDVNNPSTSANDHAEGGNEYKRPLQPHQPDDPAASEPRSPAEAEASEPQLSPFVPLGASSRDDTTTNDHDDSDDDSDDDSGPMPVGARRFLRRLATCIRSFHKPGTVAMDHGHEHPADGEQQPPGEDVRESSMLPSVGAVWKGVLRVVAEEADDGTIDGLLKDDCPSQLLLQRATDAMHVEALGVSTRLGRSGDKPQRRKDAPANKAGAAAGVVQFTTKDGE